MAHKQVRDTIFVYLKPARRGKRRGAYRMLVGKPEEMKHLEDLDVHGSILVKWVFEELDVGLLLRGFSYFKPEAYARLSIFDVSATQEHIAKRFVRTGITSLEGIETTPSRIEPATFRLVAQCLSQIRRHCVPLVKKDR
jgi:hypothetical protein